MKLTEPHFAWHLQKTDPLIYEALENERRRQESTIELIAPANAVSLACLEALGSPIMNKSVEGYPGFRFHAGAQFVDVVEQAAIDRAKELFGCSYANVQPHSGTQANQAVFFALLKPGDRVLSMDLAAGGHLSHGARPNQSGRWFEVANYFVDRQAEMLDYDQIESLAVQHGPALMIAGGSAYPRVIDFARMRKIADRVGAYFLVDMAHIAGLVAAGVHPSPLQWADVVTCTLTKTLRGPPGGIILSNRNDLGKKLQSAVFPGVQGSFHSQDVAAKAVALGEALRPAYREYGHRVVENARALADSLKSRACATSSSIRRCSSRAAERRVPSNGVVDGALVRQCATDTDSQPLRRSESTQLDAPVPRKCDCGPGQPWSITEPGLKTHQCSDYELRA